ncbi:MAG: hypothetical protein H0Z37_09495 [Firmicutes bacterium]|nr:hypothetical protein [Bacillota bacterium]
MGSGQDLFLALDGGGTKTDIVVFDGRGRIQARRIAGPSNLQNLGEDRCREVLQQGIAASLQAAGASMNGLAYACLGVGGLDTDEDLASYRRIAAAIFGPRAGRVQLESDGYIALHSGTAGRPGIALIAGTGSMAVGLNEEGQRARSGGWGALFGDEGSAFDVGRQGVARALRAIDGRGPATLLVEELERATGLAPADLAASLYRQENPPAAIAALAKAVEAAARRGDAAARHILEAAAGELVLCVKAVASRLDFRDRPIPVVLSGGLFRSVIVREEVLRLLSAAPESFTAIEPSLPPVGGACIAALLSSGRPISQEVLGNLAAGLASSSPGAPRRPEQGTSGSQRTRK